MRLPPRALGLAVPGVGAAAAVALIGVSPRNDIPPPYALGLTFAVLFCLSGVVALAGRPDNNVGLLLYVAGLGFAVSIFPLSTNAALFTLGLTLNSFVFAVIVHLLLVYPAGTLGVVERRLAVTGYVLAVAGPALSMFFSRDPGDCSCGHNLLFVYDNARLESIALALAPILAALLLAAVVVVLARRWRSASPAYRRALRGVYAAGGIAIGLLSVSFAVQPVSHWLSSGMIYGAIAAMGAVPLILLAGLLGPRRARALVGRVVAELGPAPAPGHLREALRSALHDPTLEVGYWLPDLPGFVDIDGRPFDPSEAPAATYVDGEEGRIGVVTHDAALQPDDATLDGLVSALRLVLENERLHADLRSKLVEIQRNQSFTELIVDNAPAFFCAVDADGRLRNGINDPLLAATGYGHRSEVADKFFWDVFCVPEEVEETKARLASVAAGLDVGVQEARLPVPDGSSRVVEWRDSVMPDEHGQLMLIVRAGLDVTDRKRQADEQAALRRVATVVAASGSLETIVATVGEEIAALFGSQTLLVARAEHDELRVVGGWTAPGIPPVVLGRAWPLERDMAMTRAILEAVPQRVDAVGELRPGAGADFWRELGVTGAIAAPIFVDGGIWGVISASRTGTEPFPANAEDRLSDMGALIAQALANAAARAELSASRVRIVQAADDARRRLERNLHDGAQQRLVSLSITLRLAEAKIDSDPSEARAALRGASDELSQALAELRELARGIHPAILSDRGLGPALQALAERATLPVEVANELDAPLPPQVEAAAYYVVSEALANVAKHAQARVARVRVSRRDGLALVEIEDDGVGGADPSGGSGLRGLADRVEALDGRLGIAAANGRGTRVWAEIPYL